MKTKSEKPIKGEVPPNIIVMLDKLKINKLLNIFGIEVVKKDCNYYSYYWEKAYKKIDLKTIPVFSEIAKTVIEHKTSFLNYDRLYTLWQFVNGINSDETTLAEIGAYWGGSAWFIAESLRKTNRKNRFFVFDTFEGHVIVDKSIDGQHDIGRFSDTSYKKVRSYLSLFENVSVIKGDFMKTKDTINNEKSFSLVHIDVDVYPITKYCLNFFENKMVVGGVMIVDDYGFTTCKGAKKAVDEFVMSNNNFRLIHLITGQAVIMRLGK